MPDTPPLTPFDTDALLRRFKTAACKVAQGRPYLDVLQGLGEFGELQRQHHAEEGSASLFPWGEGAGVWLAYFTGTPTFAPNGVVDSVEPSDRVLRIELYCTGGSITLSEVERVMGPWYRDPPSPSQVSFAHAYFNTQAICPSPGLFLYAVSEPYADALGPQSPICTVGLAYGDQRYGTKEPW